MFFCDSTFWGVAVLFPCQLEESHGHVAGVRADELAAVRHVPHNGCAFVEVLLLLARLFTDGLDASASVNSNAPLDFEANVRKKRRTEMTGEEKKIPPLNECQSAPPQSGRRRTPIPTSSPSCWQDIQRTR
jgi:hypothetical protein